MENNMLIDIDSLVVKYNLKINGVIHVGGHIGEEIPIYKKYTNNIHVFEPQEHCFNQIDPTVNKHCVALGETDGELILYVANNNQSSSLLRPKEHLVQHPDVVFTHIKKVKVTTLDSFNITNSNFINLDVQGYELSVLKGASTTLHSVDYIYTEINVQETYEDCALIDDLDKYLDNYSRVETVLCGSHGWGDAFYVRKNKL
jgi:FkbM family methyltransferase